MARQRVACPSCGDNDSSSNNLYLFEDDETAGWCFLESKRVSLTGGREIAKYSSNRDQAHGSKDDALEIASCKRLPSSALIHKPISKETCDKYSVRVSMSETDGSVERVYYPYIDSENVTTGYKIRTLPKTFSVIGKLKGLFGQQQCKKGAKLLVITEGEDDALAAYQMFQSKGKDWNVVSIPYGANIEGALDQGLKAELEFITSHALVAICFDTDKPGQATAKALADLLCSQCRVKIIKLPKKDAGQMLIDGLVEDFFKEFWTTPDFHPEKIVKGSELTLERLKEPRKPGYMLPYPKLNMKLDGLRKGEITLVTGGSGLGKTLLVRELAFDLVNRHNLTVANIMLETPMEDVARSYIAMDNDVPPYKLMKNPGMITPEHYQASYDKLLKSDKFLFFEHWGSLDSEILLRKCHYFAKVLGADFIILDHISLAVAGIDTDERKALDVAFEALTRLCVETGVGVIVVMHLKRVQGKSWAAGDEVELTDLRGTAGAEQMSWTVLSVERNSKDEATRDVARVRVIKNRTTGHLGMADSLNYSHETGRLSLLEAVY